MRAELLAAWISASALLGCEESAPASKPRPAEPASQSGARRLQGPARPRRALELDASAYRVRIDFDDETLVVASPQGVHFVAPGGQAETIARDFGDTFALSGSRVIYFSSGELLESRRGGPPTSLGPVSSRPSSILIDSGHIAWIQQGSGGGAKVFTFDGKTPRQITALDGRVDTATLLGNWVFFLEQSRAGTWRLGGVSLDGGTPVQRPWSQGRVPATLAAQGDLFYYDGPSRTVRRVTPDLAHEQIVARDVICSPLAVVARVFCAHVGGVRQLPLSGGAAAPIVSQGHLVTALAASNRQLAWVSDSGEGRLRVETLDLDGVPTDSVDPATP